MATPPTAEHGRLATAGAPEGPLSEAGPWAQWGPYLSERAWGTVREDYSPGGTAWEYFPHDHARSRAYRWNEDGMAGISDIHGRLCLALALWNGRDPILKERMFGLTGNEGNHGEDVKEYWWFTDALPSHALLKWRYHYPQQAFPYEDLLETNRARGRLDPEYELLDTGVFDGGYWIVETTYAKVEPNDILLTVSVRNAGPEADTIHVLPSLWFRNTWTWDPGTPVPRISLDGDGDVALVAEHEALGTWRLEAAPGPDGAMPTALFCDNETNDERVFGTPGGGASPKDGINDHVVGGAATVNPANEGTKSAWWYRLEVQPGETAEVHLRFRDASVPDVLGVPWSGDVRRAIVHERETEADEFYATLTPADASPEEAVVMRQAFAGMIWSKQYYPYDVSRWLDGDPGQPPPPAERRSGRNANWRSLDAADVLSMPDPWEYPWFAAWDLAFHTVVFAHVDPWFAKYQLLALTREWFLHPNGALPAYEWSFDDVNPPVHAWAALKVYVIDGAEDRAFLERIFLKLLANFTWWINRVDAEGNNLFEGGFLGLDNIGPFDRSHLPVAGELEQSDGTAWMAFYSLAMLRIAAELAKENRAYDVVITKFLEHFVSISRAMNEQGLWDAEEGYFFDRLSAPGQAAVELKYRSILGVLPLLAGVELEQTYVEGGESLRKRFAWFTERTRGARIGAEEVGSLRESPDGDSIWLSIVDADKLRRVLAEALDEESLLSPYGLRALSRRHLANPFTVEVGGVTATVDYEPAESTSGMFGGNSNWRGPVWFPVNYLVIEALERFGHSPTGDLTVECPTGSGVQMTLHEVADVIRRRLISIFLPGPDGRRPVHGWVQRFTDDPDWSDLVFFHEYFHGDNGAGLGASHQTGWTGLVADLITGRRERVGTKANAGTASKPPKPEQAAASPKSPKKKQSKKSK
ncbi:MAG TPA: glucosidase [Actinomycetota bacterium]|nr:glucosidase [Actinomycetota bacterium]